MSKAELFAQLESLTRPELDALAVRVEELRQCAEPVEELTPKERAILEERLARHAAAPSAGERWEAVRDRVLGEIKSRTSSK
jgi:hypothetical protein